VLSRVRFGARARLADLPANRVLLITVLRFVHGPVARFRMLLVNGLVNCRVDRVRLRMADPLVNRAITSLLLDSITGAATARLARRRTLVIATVTMVVSLRNIARDSPACQKCTH
jgi:hypothetical protein